MECRWCFGKLPGWTPDGADMFENPDEIKQQSTESPRPIYYEFTSLKAWEEFLPHLQDENQTKEHGPAWWIDLCAVGMNKEKGRKLIETLLETKSSFRVHRLSVQQNPVAAGGNSKLWSALLQDPGSSLQWLDLSDTYLSEKGFDRVWSSLTHNQCLEWLDLSCCSVPMLISSPTEVFQMNHTLRHLSLQHSGLTDSQLKQLVGGLGQNYGLESLGLRHNSLTHESVMELFHSSLVRSKAISHLDLQGNPIGWCPDLDNALEGMIQMGLLHLNLSSCNLSIETFLTLSNPSHPESQPPMMMCHLDISNNFKSVEPQLVETVLNHLLRISVARTLVMNNCSIQGFDVGLLLNSWVRELSLSMNEIDTPFAEQLGLELDKANDFCLEHLDLSLNRIQSAQVLFASLDPGLIDYEGNPGEDYQ